MIFWCILASSWEAFGLIFASILRTKFHQKMHSKFHRFLDRFWEAFGLPWPSIWLPKSLPKSIQVALGAQGAPWSVPRSLRTLKSHQKWSPKWAQDPQNRPFGRLQASKTEPQSAQHRIPETPDFQKWSLAQGTPNAPKTNQTSSQTNAKFETKLDPIWNQPGTKFWIH